MKLVSERQSDDYLTTEEVRLRLEQLTAADFQRLRQISGYIARSGQDAEDLRQEAYLRALDGTRRCGRDEDFIRFLAGSMQSIQHSKRKAAGRARPHQEALERDPTAAMASAPDEPLETLLKEEDEFCFVMGKLQMFGDDPVALAVLEGIMEGFQGAELCELVGITPQELATKRRLIKRRLDAAGGLNR
jgi:DNA-directed RNA polymerase specialized sigma24 family protein